jgi:hypothetical protein
VRDGADQRFAKQLGLRTHFRVVEGARDIEPLECRHSVRKRVVDTLAHAGERLARHAAEIDGDAAEIRSFWRDPANEPDVALAVVDRAFKSLILTDTRDLRTQAFRHAVGGAGVRRAEQHHLALHEMGQVILDGDEYLGGAGGRSKPPGKRIEIAHLLLALARNRGLALRRIGEVRHHHGDDHEQDQIERFLRRSDAETVELGKEQIARQNNAGDRGNQCRDDAKVIAREHHRDEVEHGAAQDAEIFSQQDGDGRGQRHQQQRNDNAAQLAPHGRKPKIWLHPKRRSKIGKPDSGKDMTRTGRRPPFSRRCRCFAPPRRANFRH